MLSIFSREGNGKPLQYSCLENPMDGGAWWAAFHGVATSRSQLSDFTFTFHFHEMEKEMATHSSVLAWRIPGTGEPGGLLSMGSHRVGHDWSDLAAAAAASFHVSIGQFVCLLWRTKLYELFIYFWKQPLVSCNFCKYFLPVQRFSFQFVYSFLCCAKSYKFD